MDSSAFNRMDFGGIWWLFFWAALGIVAAATGIIMLAIYLVHHVRWI